VLKEVIETFRAGNMVIMVDDENRENEGDIVAPAQFVTEAQIKFMMQYGRGLICVSLPSARIDSLSLKYQSLVNQSVFQTPFTVSISAKGYTSETASDRSRTIRMLCDETKTINDFESPGSVFPLKVHKNGVLGRRGQTEGSSDLARIAGLYPAGVICEILAEDGSMLRGKGLMDFAALHNLPVTSVEEIARYRREVEVYVSQVSERDFNTDYGLLRIKSFQDKSTDKEHLAIIVGTPKENPLVRIHSECLTGDIFGSRRCDCGPQLHRSLAQMQKEGGGVLLYLRQEGRGIGLSNKIKAYALQDEGKDTVEANELLGFEPDERDFMVAVRILKFLGIERLRLMTNNPDKLETLSFAGINVTERVPLTVPVDEFTKSYLLAKKLKLGHLL
jgi:3,4-dihydroxy 2-butanone 4-phosphate synthase/GTP cyclohydrolase II